MQVIARDGVAAVSVRSVAAQAGLSPSALRYHFATQESLLSAQVGAGLAASIQGPRDFSPDDPAAGLSAALEQFLPMDAESQGTVKALYGTVVAGYTLPAVAASVQDLYARTRTTISAWLTDLAEDGFASAEDPSTVDDLIALIDGLSMNLIIGTITADTARQLVARRVQALARSWPALSARRPGAAQPEGDLAAGPATSR